MKELIEKTKELQKQFREKSKGNWKDWGNEAVMIDLVEEVGELANAVLVKENYKRDKRKKADLEDSLADVLFDVILLSANYGIDLEKEYKAMLARLEARVKGNEF
ncbi:MAG: MazG-like family protein [Candidatus Diapherotrites archaeon]|nr:MazG-like family protein [Candidatus Diapherotrites archaeon]